MSICTCCRNLSYLRPASRSARFQLCFLACSRGCSARSPRASLLTRRVAMLSQTAVISGGLGLKPARAAETGKKENVPIEQLRDIVAHDFQSNQYYITGKLTPAVFTDDCVFLDPTTRVQGVEKYSKAVAALFDRSTSRADLISIEVKDPRTILARWRFAASLNVPGKPKLKPYTGNTTYKLNSDGLIYEHAEEWDISALDAFVSILLPNFGAAPAPPVENPVNI